MKSLAKILLLSAFPVLVAPVMSHATQYCVDLTYSGSFFPASEAEIENGIYQYYEYSGPKPTHPMNTSPTRFFFDAQNDKEIAATVQSFMETKLPFNQIKKQLPCYLKKSGTHKAYEACVAGLGGYQSMAMNAPTVETNQFYFGAGKIESIYMWKPLGEPTALCSIYSNKGYDCQTWLREHRP